MTAEEQATATLARMTAATESPVLTSSDLTALLSMYHRLDGTWNLRRAAAEGWRWKAGRVAGGFSFSADGVAVDKTMLMKHALDMAARYDAEAARFSGVSTVALVSSINPYSGF